MRQNDYEVHDIQILTPNDELVEELFGYGYIDAFSKARNACIEWEEMERYVYYDFLIFKETEVVYDSREIPF